MDNHNHGDDANHVHKTKSGEVEHSHSSIDTLAQVTRSRLWIVFVITASFMFVEAIVGYLANSLALMADAGHMLNDVISIALALAAIKIASIKSDTQNTFGYKRVEVLSGLINGISLILIGGYITIEAINRFQNLEGLVINGPLMLGTAFIGLIVNISGIFLLQSSKDDSINMEGAYEHIMADLLGSVAAIVAGVGILFWEAYWLDLLASISVSILVLRSGFSITIRATKILLEAGPEGIILDDVIASLRAIPGVIDIHDFHAWRVTNNWDVIMTHVTCEKDTDQTELLSLLKTTAEGHGFNHPTFQIEFLPCVSTDTICN